MADSAPATFSFGEDAAVTITVEAREQWRRGFLRHMPFFVGRPLRVQATMSKIGTGPLPKGSAANPHPTRVRFLLRFEQPHRPVLVNDLDIPDDLGAEPVTVPLDGLGMLPHTGQSNIVANRPDVPEQNVYVLWGIMPESYLVPAVVSLLVGLAIVALSFVLRPSIVINIPPTP